MSDQASWGGGGALLAPPGILQHMHTHSGPRGSDGAERIGDLNCGPLSVITWKT